MKSILVFFTTLFLFGSLGVAAGSVEQNHAPLVIEEFADFECTYCSQGNDTMKSIAAEYGEQIKFVFRNFPLSFHKYSLIAAKAHTAIALQDPTIAQRWRDLVFAQQKRLSEEGETFIFEVAAKIGVDLEKMKVDMESPTVTQIIEGNQKRAADLGFKGTPSYLIGTERVQGARSVKEIKQIIDQQLIPKTR